MKATIEFFEEITSKFPIRPGEPACCEAALEVDENHIDMAKGFCGLCIRGFNACAEAVRPQIDDQTIAAMARAIRSEQANATNEFNCGEIKL
jgi:hypothetical protein